MLVAFLCQHIPSIPLLPVPFTFYRLELPYIHNIACYLILTTATRTFSITTTILDCPSCLQTAALLLGPGACLPCHCMLHILLPDCHCYASLIRSATSCLDLFFLYHSFTPYHAFHTCLMTAPTCADSLGSPTLFPVPTIPATTYTFHHTRVEQL